MPEPGSGTISVWLEKLRKILGPEGLLTDPASCLVYARDASHLTLGRPLAVALPSDENQLVEVVSCCREANVAVVCRGSGTGLSGGAVPPRDALVLGTARLTDLGPVDGPGRRVRVQPGVLNDTVSRHASALGLHFAPDPSSQAAATIGGNIAENAGGPHCLRYGVTLQHLLQMDWADAAGRRLRTGRGLAAERGLDLVSLLCGSEGTLGVITGADLKLVPDSAAVTTLLAFFPSLADGALAVGGLLQAGLSPVAVEMVDQPMLQAVEEAFAFGFPTDVEAAMIVEFAGRAEEVAEDCLQAGSLLESRGAREVRRAATADERAELWKCRKRAFGAVGRLAPSYVTMDVVVPLEELPFLVGEIQAIKQNHGVEVATAFHAGDGNLHPGVHYDDRDPDQTKRAHAAADDIIRAALRRAGSVTGEHGVGIEKLHAVPWQIDAQSAGLQRDIKEIFDPANILNPGKLHPPADSDFAPEKPVPPEVVFRWKSLTVTAPAGASFADIQQRALAKGFWIPVGVLANGDLPGLGRGGSVGDLVDELLTGPAFCAAGTARDYLLELWATTGDGKTFHTGAPVFKNVAGYDLAHMLCGSGGVYVQTRAATFQLRPAPQSLGFWSFGLSGEKLPESVLDRVLEYLAGREASLGGSVAVVDASSDGEGGSLALLVPGRSCDWDLNRVKEDLRGLVEPALANAHHEVPFTQAGTLLSEKLLPVWALESPDWHVLAAHPGHASGGALRPRQLDRFIWQAAPRLWWTPDAVAETPGFHGDQVFHGGRICPHGPPGSGVPVDLLRRLKALFDPAGSLACPGWLGGTDD